MLSIKLLVSSFILGENRILFAISPVVGFSTGFVSFAAYAYLGAGLDGSLAFRITDRFGLSLGISGMYYFAGAMADQRDVYGGVIKEGFSGIMSRFYITPSLGVSFICKLPERASL